MTRLALIAAVTAMIAACDGAEPEPVPEDPMPRLVAACDLYAQVGCQKNLQCVPPEQPACVSQAVADCLTSGTENGASCVANAAAAIERCTPEVQAMTCDDYCSEIAPGSLFCFGPCIWFCPAS